MKPITKIIIFLLVAFSIVVIITVVKAKNVVAPVTTDIAPTPKIISYTLAQVAEHKVATDCWTAVGDNVYELTPFVSKHPGGVENITKVCGINGTALFTAQHGSSQAAQTALASFRIGALSK